MDFSFPSFSIEPADFAVLGILVLLEGLLSADNALVLALLVRHLSPTERRKALLYGMAGAFVFRGIGIFFAARLIHLWWVCAAGALYLIYLAAAHFVGCVRRSSRRSGSGPPTPKAAAGFWQTILLVELTDVIFAIDSILVAVAFVTDDRKLWIVYAGGILGLLLLRLAASYFTRLIERFPRLDAVAYALVGWAGIKLASAAVDIWRLSGGNEALHLLPKWGFWAGFAGIAAVGIPYALRRRAAEAEAPPAEKPI